MKRFPDWPARLRAYLEAAARAPLVWGEHDCVLFSLGAAHAMTGVDAAENIRGKYSTELGAARLMRRLFGAANLSAAADEFCRRWNGERIGVLNAQRGDIVEGWVEVRPGVRAPALGVVMLDARFAAFVSPMGYIKISVRDCVRAWRV